MQKRFKNYLDRPFPLFLMYPQGRRYFTVLIVVTALFINLLQPFGLNNWHEYHKWLVISGYVVIYAGIYYLIFQLCSYFRPEYYLPACWTLGKEFRILLIYLPAVGFASWVFTEFAIEELAWNFRTFIRMQYYNSIIGIIMLPSFGYLVYTKITPEKPALPQPVPQDNSPIEVQPIQDKYIQVKAIRIDEADIIVVESKKNDVYIRIFHKGELKEIIDRSTMKAFRLKLKDFPHFLHCHQSFVVNLNKIQSWSTENDKLWLQLQNYTEDIHVSLKNQPFMKEILNKHLILRK